MYELYVRQLPSVLRRCWLGGRKGIWPVKTEWWGAGMVVCLEWGADLHMAQLMPRPLTVSHFSKIQIGFTFLVPAYASSPGKRDIKRVCVCNCQMTITQQHGGIVKFQLYFWLQFQNWYETVPALCQREKPSMTFSCVTGSQSYTDYTPGMCLAPVLNNIKNVFIVWETFLLVDKKRYFISNLRITFHCQSTYTSKWIT